MIRQVLSSHLDLTTIGGEKTVSRRWKRGESHPWEVLEQSFVKAKFGATMQDGAWCLVLRPGFVNGIDPIARASVGYNRSSFPGVAIASDRAGLGLAKNEAGVVVEEDVLIAPEARKDRPLLLGPMIAINFAEGKQWPGDKPPPLAIQNQGVPAAFDGPKVSANMDTMKIVVDTTHAVAGVRAGQRVAKSVDLVLGIARLGFNQDVRVDGIGNAMVNARLVTYSTSYNTQALDAFGSRGFIYQIADADAAALVDAAAKNPSMMDRLTGTGVTDDNIDKSHILRVWALSPGFTQKEAEDPEFDPFAKPVDDKWNLAFEYRTFWNLCYRAKSPMPKEPPPTISFPWGLGIGGGFGGTIINTYLALKDELTGKLYEAMQVTPAGKFWTI